MSQFSFAGYEMQGVTEFMAPASAKLGEADTPMRDGGFLGRQFAAARTITIHGTMVARKSPAESYYDMEHRFSDMQAALLTAGTARLSARPNWFYLAACKSCADTERQPGYIEWEATFSLGDHRQYRLGPDDASGSVDAEGSASPSWGSQFAIPGRVRTPIRLSLLCAASHSALVTITPTWGGLARSPLLWRPGASAAPLVSDGGVSYQQAPDAPAQSVPAGQQVPTLVYPDRQRAYRAGVEVTREFDGSFFLLPAGQCSLSVGPAVGSGVSSPLLYYREAKL